MGRGLEPSKPHLPHLTEPFSDAQVVRCDDEGGFCTLECSQPHVEKVCGGRPVELTGRFVSQDELRLIGERPRHPDALRLAAGEFFGEFVG